MRRVTKEKTAIQEVDWGNKQQIASMEQQIKIQRKLTEIAKKRTEVDEDNAKRLMHL